jgi:DNA modification methylase
MLSVSDAVTFIDSLPDESIDSIVTSPPYFQQRDYGIEGQIGLEDTPQAYIARLVAVFSAAW